MTLFTSSRNHAKIPLFFQKLKKTRLLNMFYIRRTSLQNCTTFAMLIVCKNIEKNVREKWDQHSDDFMPFNTYDDKIYSHN